MFAMISAIVAFNLSLIALAISLMVLYFLIRVEVKFVKVTLNIIVYPIKKVFG